MAGLNVLIPVTSCSGRYTEVNSAYNCSDALWFAFICNINVCFGAENIKYVAFLNKISTAGLLSSHPNYLWVNRNS